MLRWAIDYSGPVAIRYPRGGDSQDLQLEAVKKIELGKWEVLKSGGDIAILAVGKMVSHALLAAKILEEEGIAVSVVNAYSVKPLDYDLLDDLSEKGYKIVTIEDNVINGGFGSLVLSYICNNNKNNIEILNLGYKDSFIQQGSPDLLYSLLGLDPKGIAKSILARFYKRS